MGCEENEGIIWGLGVVFDKLNKLLRYKQVIT